MNKQIGVAILGGSGYGAGELLRILACHPQAHLVSVVSTSQIGKSVVDVHQHLLGFYEQRFVANIDWTALSKFEQSVVFSSLPHEASAREIIAIMPELQQRGIKLIDLSGDFRLTNEASHLQHYPHSPFAPELRAQFVYGIPEINRKRIQQAQFITNPGCLATAGVLVAAPLVAAGFSGDLVLDAKTGTSGAGRTPQIATHHPSRSSNLIAYKILEHRHEPEIVQALKAVSDVSLQTSFVPHLLPIARGIFVSAYATFADELVTKGLEESCKNFYASSPFVRFRRGTVEIQNVLGTNFFDFSVTVRGRQVVALGVLDNLVKGAAGQAVQNMNLICGLSESAGLWNPALGPS